MQAFHGELSSADASAGAAITLYLDGTTTVYNVQSNDVVTVTDVTIVAGAALTVTLFDGVNNTVDPGEKIATGNFGANGGQSSRLGVPHTCQRGTGPRVKTSTAGQVDVLVRGLIGG